jgi:hypothetical protein
MREANLQSMGENTQRGAADEDEDEDGRGGQRVQCAQQ